MLVCQHYLIPTGHILQAHNHSNWPAPGDRYLPLLPGVGEAGEVLMKEREEEKEEGGGGGREGGGGDIIILKGEVSHTYIA